MDTMTNPATGVHLRTDSCDLHGCKPIRPIRPLLPEAIKVARDAIDAMYAEWEATGGASPDIADEIAAAAEALGYQQPRREHELEDKVHELRSLGSKTADRLADTKIAKWLLENGRIA